MFDVSSTPSTRRHPLQVLSNRPFLLLWIGLLVSSVGDWINYVAMVAVVYQQTHSALALAILRLFHIVPILIVAPVAGVFVDRWSRRRTLIAAPLVSGVAVAALALSHPVWAVFTVYGIITVALAFYNPARSAIVPNIVSPAELVTANSLSQITSTGSIVFGAVIGGLLVSRIGPSAAFAVNALSFAIVAAAVGAIRVVERHRDETVASVERELLDGLRAIGHQPLVAAVILSGAIYVFPIATVLTLGIAFTESALHGGAAAYGTILLGLGAGSLLGVAGMITVRNRVRHDLIFAGGGLVLGSGILALGLTHSVPAAAVAYSVAGLGEVAATVSAVTLLQQRVPDALRGRIFGVQSTFDHTAAFASTLVVGIGAGALGAAHLIALSGLAAIVAGIAALVVLRA